MYAVNAMGASPVVVLPTPGQTGAAAPPRSPTAISCLARTATTATLAWTVDEPSGVPLVGFQVFYEVSVGAGSSVVR